MSSSLLSSSSSSYLCVRCGAAVLQLQADVAQTQAADEEALLQWAAEVFGEAPLCEVCMQSGISEISREVETLRGELGAARQTLGELGASEAGDLRALETELTELTETLEVLETREGKLRGRVAELEREERKLQETSEEVFRAWLEAQEKTQETESGNLGVDRKIRNLREDLRQLKRLNVVDATFRISVEREVGLINGLRLGGANYKAAEVNAALGQVALLLQFVQTRTTSYSSSFRVAARGSGSFLRPDEGARNGDSSHGHGHGHGHGQERLELFLASDAGGGGAARLWASGSRKFDAAMQALLQTVQELLQHCVRGNRGTLRVPYKIELPEKIGNCSVNLQFHGEPQWTQAMKYLLTNLKFLLLHTEISTSSLS